MLSGGGGFKVFHQIHFYSSRVRGTLTFFRVEKNPLLSCNLGVEAGVSVGPPFVIFTFFTSVSSIVLVVVVVDGGYMRTDRTTFQE